MDQRALEGNTLPHATREARDRIRGPMRQPRALERRVSRCGGLLQRIEARKELQVLSDRQFGIQEQIYGELDDTGIRPGGGGEGVAA